MIVFKAELSRTLIKLFAENEKSVSQLIKKAGGESKVGVGLFGWILMGLTILL